MLRLISVLLLAQSLPRPFASFFGTPLQETLDAGQISTPHFGERVSQEHQILGALPSPNEDETLYEVICADPQGAYPHACLHILSHCR